MLNRHLYVDCLLPSFLQSKFCCFPRWPTDGPFRVVSAVSSFNNHGISPNLISLPPTLHSYFFCSFVVCIHQFISWKRSTFMKIIPNLSTYFIHGDQQTAWNNWNNSSENFMQWVLSTKHAETEEMGDIKAPQAGAQKKPGLTVKTELLLNAPISAPNGTSLQVRKQVFSQGKHSKEGQCRCLWTLHYSSQRQPHVLPRSNGVSLRLASPRGFQ